MKNKMLTVQAALLIITLSAASVQAQERKAARSSSTRTERTSGITNLSVHSDSDEESVVRITMQKDGDDYRIRIVNDKITELYINDKKIAEEDYGKYEPMIKELREQMKRDREQAARNREQAAIDRQRASRDREEAQRHRERATRDREQANKNRERAGRDREQAERNREQAQIDRKRAAEDRKLLHDLIDDLVKENIIKDKEDVQEIELSDESLIVNDKKQAAELHRQFKAKYLKKPGSRLTFTNGTDGRSLQIERDN
jgi:hypothetical protein